MKFTGERFIPEYAEGVMKAEHMHRYQYITELIKGRIVLDAACGDGYGTDIIAANALKAYGIDISNEAIDIAKNKYKSDNLEFITSSISILPFEDASFDVVVSFETIEHVDEETQRHFLNEVKRILKTDGILIMSTPNKLVYSDIPGYKNDYHFKEFYVKEFDDFLKSYFRHVNLFSQGFEKYSVINSLKDSYVNSVNNIFQNYKNETQKTYIIAICSDNKVETFDRIQSIAHCNDLFQSHIYLDFGEGFSEQNKTGIIMVFDGANFACEFDLPEKKGIKGLRWDPVEGYYCKIRVEKLVLDEGYIRIRTSNATSRKEGFDIFTTIDPIYEFEGDYRNASILRLEGKIGFFSSAELYEKINEMDKHNKSIMDKNDGFAAEIKQLKSDSDTIQKEKLWFQESYEINLKENKKLHEYYESVAQEKAVLLQNNTKILENLLALQGENAGLQVKYFAEIKEKESIQDKYHSLMAEKEELLNKYNRLEVQLDDCRNTLSTERDGIRKELDSTLNSVSWKITKPLRALRRILKRTSN